MPPNYFADRYGDGTISQWLSIDLQTWDLPGLLSPRTAKQCNEQQFLDEILAHAAAKNPAWNALDRRDIVRYQHSPFLTYPSDDGGPHNDEPLWGPLPGSWAHQPDAATKVENLFIGSPW